MAKYSFEFKKKIVKAYINGEGGYTYLSKKYGIVIPIIEAAMGYDFIIGEDLTDFECGIKVVFALVDVATLGTSIIATGGTKIGAKGIAKVVLVEFASNATATTIGCVGNELGLPVGVTMLLSMLGGSYVGIKGSKVGGKIPLDDFKNIRVKSIQNINSDTITLGKYRPTVKADGNLTGVFQEMTHI